MVGQSSIQLGQKSKSEGWRWHVSPLQWWNMAWPYNCTMMMWPHPKVPCGMIIRWLGRCVGMTIRSLGMCVGIHTYKWISSWLKHVMDRLMRGHHVATSHWPLMVKFMWNYMGVSRIKPLTSQDPTQGLYHRSIAWDLTYMWCILYLTFVKG